MIIEVYDALSYLDREKFGLLITSREANIISLIDVRDNINHV